MDDPYETPFPTDMDPAPDGAPSEDAEGRYPDSPWRITDDGAAEWAMRKVVVAQRAIDAATVQAGAWYERIGGRS